MLVSTGPGPFCVDFACSPCVFSPGDEFPSTPQSRDIHRVRLSGDSKVTLGVNGCLSRVYPGVYPGQLGKAPPALQP